jgi:hypothetical protein
VAFVATEANGMSVARVAVPVIVHVVPSAVMASVEAAVLSHNAVPAYVSML